MRKQELIHLHGLLKETATYLEEEYRDTVDIDYDTYDSLDVRPTSIHRSKDDHKEALYTLSKAITDAITEQYDSFDEIDRELEHDD